MEFKISFLERARRSSFPFFIIVSLWYNRDIRIGICEGAFCGYGVAVKDFKNPIIDFDRNNTYIQSEGINQDFGVYDSPDDLLKAHHQEMSAIKAFLYKHFGRHLMNRNIKKIRNC